LSPFTPFSTTGTATYLKNNRHFDAQLQIVVALKPSICDALHRRGTPSDYKV
jgi:hypothetical protein